MLIKTKIGNEEYTKKATVEDVLDALDYAIDMQEETTPMVIVDWACSFYQPVGLTKEDILNLPSEEFVPLIQELTQSFGELVGSDDEEDTTEEKK